MKDGRQTKKRTQKPASVVTAKSLKPVAKRRNIKPVLTRPDEAYHHGNLREALIEYGIFLLDSEGIDNMSLRSAARLAGVSQTAPKNHFGDKEGLLAAIAARGFELLTQTRLVVMKDAISPEQKLRGMIWGYVKFAMERSALFNVMFGPAVRDKSRYPELEAAGNRSYEFLLSEVKAYASSRPGMKRMTRHHMLAVWCGMHGLANLLCNHQHPPRFDESESPEMLCDELCRFIIASLKN